MTPLEATNAIYVAARAALPGTTFCLGDEKFTAVRGTPWIRLSIIDLPPTGMSLGVPGERRKECRGILVAQCFAPRSAGDGSAGALALARDIRVVFDGRDITGAGATDPAVVNFQAAGESREGADGPWYQVNVNVPFTFVEIV